MGTRGYWAGFITRNGAIAEFDRADQVLEWRRTVLHSVGSEPSIVLVPDASDRGLDKQCPAYIADELAALTRFSARHRDGLRQGHVRLGMPPGDSALHIDRRM